MRWKEVFSLMVPESRHHGMMNGSMNSVELVMFAARLST